MKHCYPFLFMCSALLLLSIPSARGQNWRPFRPNGNVHAFRGTSADTVLTLRLDSAGTQGPDSVYYFNRIMRRANVSGTQYQWRMSRNNQFGQHLRYSPAERSYALFWNGGPTTGLTLDITLVLKPFARVGDTWSSAFTDYGVPTTLVSRGVALIDGVQDSIATFRLGAAPGKNVVLSKNYGLVSGPANLLFGGGPSKTLSLARRPAPATQSFYDPLAVLDLQPGDELGYYYEITGVTVSCGHSWTLRRVLSRQVTTDSVAYLFQEQTRFVNTPGPNCSPAGTYLSPITRIRVAASRRTGRWAGDGRPSGRMLPINPDLLAYEYRLQPQTGLSTRLMMGYPVVNNRTSFCNSRAPLRREMLYRLGAGPTFIDFPAIDLEGWYQVVAEGIGPVAEYYNTMTYFSRTANGVIQTCGNRANFATLLPTRAAQHAALLKLHPNPAAETATFTLPTPARAGTRVSLLDELGRTVKTQDVATGQTDVQLNLRGLAAGVYVAEVQATGETPLRTRVQHVE